jgi:hypothetical protein
MLVEAADKLALGSGMQGFQISIPVEVITSTGAPSTRVGYLHMKLVAAYCDVDFVN